MIFQEKIKPHLVSKELLVQDGILHAIHDYPFIPGDWTTTLLKEAFSNKDKQTSILIYIDNQVLNEEGLQVLIENIPLMDQKKQHLGIHLLHNVEPEVALSYKDSLSKYLSEEIWTLYELFVHGTEEEVYTEYAKLVNELEESQYYKHELFMKTKKLAACIVKNGWITEEEIDITMNEELKSEWLSYEGILTIYMIGLLKLEKYIPILAQLLVSDEDVLLEEVAAALIRYQSDEVVEQVAPYLLNEKSFIYATSVVENTKTDRAIEVLREAYRQCKDLEDQDLIFEALCHQFSEEAIVEIKDHMKKPESSFLVDVEQTAYAYFTILGIEHPEMEEWKSAVLNRMKDDQDSLIQQEPIRNEVKIGRNDPCLCGSGKKYKKCCGK